MDDEEATDPIGAERKRRQRAREALTRRAGEPPKPEIKELRNLHPGFVAMLKGVLAE